MAAVLTRRAVMEAMRSLLDPKSVAVEIYRISDRNLIDFYADTGISIIGLDDKRPHDKIGLGFAYTRVSNRARDLEGQDGCELPGTRDEPATAPRRSPAGRA